MDLTEVFKERCGDILFVQKTLGTTIFDSQWSSIYVLLLPHQNLGGIGLSVKPYDRSAGNKLYFMGETNV